MPPVRRRQGKADSPGLQIDLDGKTYIVREADLTPHDVRALRKETGFSWAGLGKALAADPDIDLIGALVWLARRVRGEDVSYEAVLDDLSYESDLNVKVEDKRAAVESDDSGEASDAG